MTPRQWRNKTKLTLDEAAIAVGVGGQNPARTFQRWEIGERAPPADVIQRIAKLSGGSVQKLDWPRPEGSRQRRSA